MHQFNYDIQNHILSYLSPKSVVQVYLSSNELKTMIQELAKHYKGFQVKCTKPVSDKTILWYKKHNIRLSLVRKCVTDCYGTYFYENGKKHSIDDQPAVIYNTGRKQWLKYGKLHRDGDKPAVVSPVDDVTGGFVAYFRDGLIHRDGKPAVIYRYGYQLWFQNGIQIDNIIP